MSEQIPLTDEQKKKKRTKPRMVTWDRVPTDTDTDKFDQAIDWDARESKGRGLLHKIEHLALLAKEPVDKVVGSPQLNPLYYSGTIAFFLFAVVVLTGVYVLMFFQYGYDVSYLSIESMDRFFVSRAARAIHRYASGGLIIFTILHAIRMLFMDRFRGPRWLAWFAGVITALILWLAGITGYWLIWDQGAQLITQTLLNFLQLFPTVGAFFYLNFLANAVADENGWILMLLITAAHLILTALAGLFYWYHIMRLKRPKFLPPRYWMIGMAALLVIAGLLFPTGLLPNADLSIIPNIIPLDPIFLYYIPPALRSPVAALWVWVIIFALTALAAAIPWLFPRKKLDPITITTERCTGCKQCAEDCPYGALNMEARPDDGTPFELIAIVDESRCVSCGICVGSCNTLAIALGDHKPELLWQDIATRLDINKQTAETGRQQVKMIFTCERHATHGAHTYLHTSESPTNSEIKDTAIEVVPVTCVAMINPNLITRTLEAGAAEVQVVGCLPNDCTNREGNVWTEERLNRERTPKLKPSFKDAPIFTTWVAPDHFTDAIPLHAAPDHVDEQHPPTTFEQIMAAFKPRHLIFAVVLLAIGLLLQVRITYTPYQANPTVQAMVRVAVSQAQAETEQLTLEIDGQPFLKSETLPVFDQIHIPPGEHQMRLFLTNEENSEASQILFDKTVTLSQNEALELAFDRE